MANDVKKKAQFFMISYADHAVETELAALVRKDGKREITELSRSSLIQEKSKSADKFVVIYCLNSLDKLKDLLRVNTFLAEQKNSGQVAVFVLSHHSHPNLPELAKKMQCADYQISNIGAKALRLKLNRSAEKLDDGEETSIYNRGVTGKTAKVEPVAPLEFDYDYWLYPKMTVFKKVMGKWIFEMIGPSPNVGRWKESDLKEDWGGSGFWMWTPHGEEQELFFEQKGKWIFKSKNAPEFKRKNWSFVSLDPQFVYVEPRKPLRRKVSLRPEGHLEVAINSKIAEGHLSLIEKTHEMERRFAADKKPSFDESDDMISTGDLKDLEAMIDTLAQNAAPVLSTDNDLDTFFDASGSKDAPEVTGGGANPFERKDLFDRIKDPAIQRSFFTEATDQFKNSVLWTHGRADVISLKKIDFDPKSKTLKLHLLESQSNKEFIKKIKERTIPFVHFNVNLPRAAIFLSLNTTFIRIQGDQLEYLFQEEMWQVQRRKYFRYEFAAGAPENPKARLNASMIIDRKGKKTAYKLIDISAGGAKFLAPNEDMAAWEKGNPIASLSFQVGGRTIGCEATVQWAKIQKTGPYSGRLQIGVQFKNLSKETTQWIDEQILEEMAAYFRKYKPAAA